MAGQGRALIWAQGLACGGLVAMAPGVSLLLAVLLAPGILALALDRLQGKPLARAVLIGGAAPCVGPLMRLWAMGGGDSALTGLADLEVLCAAWGAGAAGWLCSVSLPLVVRLVLDGMSRSRAARLRAERDELVRAWGLDDPPGRQVSD